MTKQLTFAQEPEGNELFIAQIDDLCGKRSALIMKRNDGHHSLLFGSIAVKTNSQGVVCGITVAVM